MAVQQSAQDHETTFAGQQFRRREIQAFENKTGEAVKGKNLQARETSELDIGEELAFELKGGLLGREDDQRVAVRLSFEGGAHFGEAAESLAAASGAKKEAHRHEGS